MPPACWRGWQLAAGPFNQPGPSITTCDWPGHPPPTPASAHNPPAPAAIHPACPCAPAIMRPDSSIPWPTRSRPSTHTARYCRCLERRRHPPALVTLPVGRRWKQRPAGGGGGEVDGLPARCGPSTVTRHTGLGSGTHHCASPPAHGAMHSSRSAPGLGVPAWAPPPPPPPPPPPALPAPHPAAQSRLRAPAPLVPLRCAAASRDSPAAPLAPRWAAAGRAGQEGRRRQGWVGAWAKEQAALPPRSRAAACLTTACAAALGPHTPLLLLAPPHLVWRIEELLLRPAPAAHQSQQHPPLGLAAAQRRVHHLVPHAAEGDHPAAAARHSSTERVHFQVQAIESAPKGTAHASWPNTRWMAPAVCSFSRGRPQRSSCSRMLCSAWPRAALPAFAPGTRQRRTCATHCSPLPSPLPNPTHERRGIHSLPQTTLVHQAAAWAQTSAEHRPPGGEKAQQLRGAAGAGEGGQ